MVRTRRGEVGFVDAPSSQKTGRGLTSALRKYKVSIASIALTLVAWQLAASLLGSSLLFPSATESFLAAERLVADGTLFSNVGITLVRMLVGFALGIAIGAPVGLLMGYFVPVRWFLEIYVNFFRFVTPIALLSVIVTWFGSGEESKYALITYVVGLLVLLQTMGGVMQVPTVTLRAARALGARGHQVFLYIVVPAAIRSMLVGMRIALGYAFMTVIAAEIIASDAGIGWVLWNARLYAQTDTAFAALLVLGLVGFLTDRFFGWAADRYGAKYNLVS